MRLRGASQPGRARRRTAAASMRGGRERGPALPGRRRLGGHACGIPARCRAPHIPQVGRCVDRARRALPVLSAEDRDRGVRAGRRDREEGPQGRVHSDHLRHANHHGAPHGLLQQARLERGGDQDRGLGGHPRQDPQQGIRRRPHAFADADRDHARRRLAAHMLSPMPIAITLGAGSTPIPYTMPAVENINGQAITLAVKHKDKTDPKSWKGLKFAVPFDYSMHNYLLRYYVAEHGIDPDQDIQIRAVPPPEMVANLRADNIDGFLAPDPVNQRAVYDGVGYIHILSKDIWDRHPCCAFAASKEFVTGSPNTYAALLKAIIDATAFATKQENRKQIAEAIAPANYLNQPVTVVEQVLTGTFADGLGNVKKVPDRIDFDPFPWESFAVWIMTQMKRWGQIKGEVDYAGVAKQVFLATDTTRLMKEVGLTPPATTSKSFVVMGKTFDPAKPEDYIKSFKIKRA